MPYNTPHRRHSTHHFRFCIAPPTAAAASSLVTSANCRDPLSLDSIKRQESRASKKKREEGGGYGDGDEDGHQQWQGQTPPAAGRVDHRSCFHVGGPQAQSPQKECARVESTGLTVQTNVVQPSDIDNLMDGGRESPAAGTTVVHCVSKSETQSTAHT